MYNDKFTCLNNCSNPTPIYSHTPPPGFKICDCTYSTYGKQALHSYAERHQKQSHKSRYALAARQLLANIGVPTYHPPPKSLVSTIDTNLANIKNWAILDSGASSHFLQVEAPVLETRETANPIQVTVANGEKVSSTHEGLIDVPDLPARTPRYQALPIVNSTTMQCRMQSNFWQVGYRCRSTVQWQSSHERKEEYNQWFMVRTHHTK